MFSAPTSTVDADLGLPAASPSLLPSNSISYPSNYRFPGRPSEPSVHTSVSTAQRLTYTGIFSDVTMCLIKDGLSPVRFEILWRRARECGAIVTHQLTQDVTHVVTAMIATALQQWIEIQPLSSFPSTACSLHTIQWCTESLKEKRCCNSSEFVLIPQHQWNDIKLRKQQ